MFFNIAPIFFCNAANFLGSGKKLITFKGMKVGIEVLNI